MGKYDLKHPVLSKIRPMPDPMRRAVKHSHVIQDFVIRNELAHHYDPSDPIHYIKKAKQNAVEAFKEKYESIEDPFKRQLASYMV